MPRYKPFMPCLRRMLAAQSTEPLYTSRPCRISIQLMGGGVLVERARDKH